MSPLDNPFQKLRAIPKLRHAVKVLLDGVLAFLAWELATLLNGTHHPWLWDGLLWALLALAISLTLHLPRQHYRAIGFRDLSRLLGGGALFLLLGGLLSFGLQDLFPGPDVWVLAALLALLFWVGLRSLVRVLSELQHSSANGAQPKRTLVVGAGRAGVLIVDELKQHPELGYALVGFVDDDLTKQGLWVHGVPVLGPQELLPVLVREERIERVILAIPSATGQEMRQLAERLQLLDVRVKTVPGIYTLLGAQAWRPELRDVSIEDLLRREPVVIDQEGLREALADRVVLITGAGGSIGSELSRQICRFHPSRLVLLGRGENSLWRIER